MAHEKIYKILVNGTEYAIPTNVVTYDEVVKIAFPNDPTNPDTLYSVTYEHAESKPHKGTLGRGGQVEAKEHGTEFDVTPTGRS